MSEDHAGGPAMPQQCNSATVTFIHEHLSDLVAGHLIIILPPNGFLRRAIQSVIRCLLRQHYGST